MTEDLKLGGRQYESGPKGGYGTRVARDLGGAVTLWAGPLLTAKHQGRWEKLQDGGLLQGTNTVFIFASWYLAKLLVQIWSYINFCEMNEDIPGEGI